MAFLAVEAHKRWEVISAKMPRDIFRFVDVSKRSDAFYRSEVESQVACESSCAAR
jgi:hypothetical protein